MRIFLVRHGSASDGLTLFGQSQIFETANFLKSLGLDTSKIILLTSQLCRAVETAEIIQKTLGLSEVFTKSWLTRKTEENTATILAQFAADHPDLVAVIAVSHRPEIEVLLDDLGFYSTRFVDTPNGSVYEIEFPTKAVTRLFVPSR